MGITTRGDQILDRTLAQVGGQGLFVKELELALACGDADLAVHSLEDVPMQRPDGFALVAVLEREDPRDAFVSDRFADIAALPPGARVGTSSLRRVAQLLALRPDLRIAPLRGNLDTRLGKLDAGGDDAIVLAAAGLMRLGLGDRVRSRFPVDQRISAAGQGAIGLEIATASAHLQRPLSTLRHAPTWLAVHAEQAVARMLGGSCSLPLGAFASFDAAGTLTLQAVLGDAALGAALDDDGSAGSARARPAIRRSGTRRRRRWPTSTAHRRSASRSPPRCSKRAVARPRRQRHRRSATAHAMPAAALRAPPDFRAKHGDARLQAASSGGVRSTWLSTDAGDDSSAVSTPNAGPRRPRGGRARRPQRCTSNPDAPARDTGPATCQAPRSRAGRSRVAAGAVTQTPTRLRAIVLASACASASGSAT